MELLQAVDIISLAEKLDPSLTLKPEFLQIIDLLALTLKELTANETFKLQQTGLFEFLFPHLQAAFKLCVHFDERRDMGRHETCCAVLVSFIACYRNQTHASNFQESAIEPVFITFFFSIIVRYPHIKEFLYNILRILSKISTSEVFCNYVCDTKLILNQLIDLMASFKENNFVVMRASYILANLTAYREDVASYVYFNDRGAILACFEHFISKTKDEDDYFESMIKSFAEFDFLNQDDKKVLNKIIRLMANMFTVEEPAIHFIKERFPQYKQLLKKLKYFMTEKELANNSELLISVLNCISNILYFDKPNMTQNDFELASLKQELTSAVAYITLQPKDEEILTEGLRVISNLSRSKNGVKNLLKLKFHEAVQILLKHRSRDVVFYSIGILINLTVDRDFKESSTCVEIFGALVELLEDCTIDDIEILGCAFKALVNIISDNLKNNSDLKTDLFGRLDKILIGFGEECDIILTSNEISPEEASEIQSLRSVINAVINVCPEEEYECTYKACLRKFRSRDQLEHHIQKRHR
jgi:hypothetical protein